MFLAFSDFKVVCIPHICTHHLNLLLYMDRERLSSDVSCSVFLVFLALLTSHSIAHILTGNIISLLLHTDRERLSIACILAKMVSLPFLTAVGRFEALSKPHNK